MGVLDETVITFAEAIAMLPVLNGKPVSRDAIHRWARIGVRGVKLESVFVGGQRRTSKEAVERFLTALNKEQAA